jgi:LmbE family N-acetylglucosaminyl deacetylase
MKLNLRSDLFIPDGKPLPEAISRTTHLGIGAHQDDLEFMAYHGIAGCFHRQDKWFGGVIVTDGKGSSRAGPYQDWTDDQLAAERVQEQRRAAILGEFSFVAQLGFPSKEVRDAKASETRTDLQSILAATQPEVVYLHNPADKHHTHVGVTLRALEAMRALPAAQRPRKVLGCEVWRSLDWLLDADKVVLPVSDRPNLAAALNGVFDTQITGGKRYDLAVMGRRLANATFFDAYASDQETHLQWAMDLSPLVQDPSLDIEAYTLGYVDRLKADISATLRKSL